MSGTLDPELSQKFFVQSVANLPVLSWFIPKPVHILNQEMLALRSELRAIEPKLVEVTVPIIIIHGTADALVPYENVTFMEKAFSNALMLETVTIEGGTHYTPWAREITMHKAIKKLAEERFDTPTKDIELDMTRWVSHRGSGNEINKALRESEKQQDLNRLRSKGLGQSKKTHQLNGLDRIRSDCCRYS